MLLAKRLTQLRKLGRAVSATELLEHYRAFSRSRREFIKNLGYGAAAVGAMPLLNACSSGGSAGPLSDFPRIAIVGGGMAGLNAAYNLQRSGIRAHVYEATSRAGGRMYSAADIMSSGLITELGGEFIDSIHDDMLALASEFGLELLDTQAPSEQSLITGYFFDGQYYSEAQVIEAFAPLAASISADYDSTGEIVDFQNEGGATALDRTSIAEYLEQIGATGFIRKLLDVAYLTEYGLENDQQSSLNLIFLIGTDQDSFEIFGESDERYKIKGGNQRIIDELANRLADQISFEFKLEALRQKGAGYALAFQSPSGTKEIDADFVILTIPFTLLRQVDLQIELPAFKSTVINQLSYGTNAKILVGFSNRIWRDLGLNGEIFTDENFQLCWDNSQLQAGESGGITFYSGGRAGLEVGSGSAEQQASRLMTGFEKALPGASAARNGRASRFHWPTFPFTLGSYAAYRPGDWTTIAG
ncbi:MAG: FAD-dependent oxidoreductase, partial [Proteobacteria bacterium]